MRGPDMTTKEGRAGLARRLKEKEEADSTKRRQPRRLVDLVDWDAIPRNRRESK